MTIDPFTRECTDCDEGGLDPSLDIPDWQRLWRPTWARCVTCEGTGRAPIMCERCDIDAATALTVEGYKLCAACKAEDDAANAETSIPHPVPIKEPYRVTEEPST